MLPSPKTSIGFSDLKARPSGPPPCTITATLNTSSAINSQIRATPRMRAVSSIWKNVSAAITMIVPNRKIHTGIDAPVHASIVVTAK